METRADAKEFLGRLGGRTLVCDCVIPHSECWAIILADAAEDVSGFSSSFGSEGRGSSGSSYVSQSFHVCSGACELDGGVPEGLVSLSDTSGSEHSFASPPGFLPTEPLIPQSLPEALRLAADAMEKQGQLQKKVDIMEPDVEALKTLTKAEGSLCLTDAAKSLGLPPRKFISWLSHNKWIYRRIGTKGWVGYQDRIQAGHVEHKVTTLNIPEGEKVVTQVRISPAGLALVAKRQLQL